MITSPWEFVQLSEAAAHVPRHMAAAFEAAGSPTRKEVALAMRAGGLVEDPRRTVLVSALSDALQTADNRRAVAAGMSALVEAILGARVEFDPKWSEPLADTVRRCLNEWIDGAEGAEGAWDLEAARDLADRPPILMVAATINRIADGVRSFAIDAVGELEFPDGGGIGNAARRISEQAWRHSAHVWVGARA